jgi:hypothetical protein
MFKDPGNIPFPVSSIPLVQQPVGWLAICAQQSSNPIEEGIDPVLQDCRFWSHLGSNVKTHQVSITCWMKQQKVSSAKLDSPPLVSSSCNQLEVTPSISGVLIHSVTCLNDEKLMKFLPL